MSLVREAQEEKNKRRREAARTHLLDFTTYTFPMYLPDPAHRLIAAKLDEVVQGKCKRLMVFMGPQHGKALAVDTPIPTPYGYRAIGDLRPGDVVFDDGGKPCNVVARSQIWRDRPVCTIRTDDGDEILADENHEWRVRLCKSHKVITTRTTKYLLDRTSPRRPMIVRQGPLDLPEQILPVDPYVLGFWLGDGSSQSAYITTGEQDREFIISEIRRIGYPVRPHTDERNHGILGLQKNLRSLNLIENKHIPPMFLRASQQQRLALLQGLIDSDGYVSEKGQIEFCNTNLRLAEGVRELVHSLGYKASLLTGRATLYGKDCGPKYRVNFFMPDAARLPRKRDLCITPTRQPNRYIDVEPAGKADTVCIQVDSPSHLFLCGKSMLPTHNSQLVSVHLPAFWLANRPNEPVILCTYAASLAHSKSREARQIVEGKEFEELFPEVQTDRASRAVDHWELAHPLRGSLLAAGVGGPIVGHGSTLGIIDDPFESWAQAYSPTIREKVWEWWRGTFRTRIRENGAVILVLTRWHEDDLAGRILLDQGDEWEVLRLPAVGETQEDRDKRNEKLGLTAGLPDPLDREPGDALCPTRFSIGALAQIKVDVGTLVWESQYMGCPTVPEGNRIKRSWLKIVDAAPANLETVWYWDKAGTEDGGAFTSGVKMGGPCEAGRYYVMNVVRGQWSAHGREKVIRQTAETEAEWEYDDAGNPAIAHPGPVIWVEQEGGSGGKESAEATVRNLAGFRIHPDRVTGDKDVRLEPFVAQAEADNIRLVRGPWNGEYIEELCAVPFGKYRDQADATAGAFNKLAGAKSMKFCQMKWWDACGEQLPELGASEPIVIALYSAKGEEPTADACFAAIAVSRHPSRPDDAAVRHCGIWIPTEGQLLDYKAIEGEIRSLCERYAVAEVAYLQVQLHDMANRLRREGLAYFRAFKIESERRRADKRLQDLIIGKRIAHDFNPILRLHIDNADVEKRGADGIRIVPRSPTLEAGGAIALAMACDRAMYYNLG